MKFLKKQIICFISAILLTGIVVYADTLPDTILTRSMYGPTMIGWLEKDGGQWNYINNGIAVRNCWENIGDHWYYFDSDGRMLTGWQELNGELYYLAEQSDDRHPKGSCYISERTPDGFLVNESGARIDEPQPEVAVSRPNPFGISCVEIDISEQMMYCYLDQNLVLASPCVTGLPGKHSTSIGTWQINSKQTSRYLQGYNDNGSKYKRWVDYWMPFHGGQGLHDASWRGDASHFGGSVYASHGSHGCVNLPHDVAAALYKVSWVGMPVIVHE